MLMRQRTLHPRIFAGLPDLDALLDLRVLVRGAEDTVHPTLAGLLAFGVYPQKFFPRLTVTFASFPGIDKAGKDGVKYLDSQTMVGSISSILEDTLAVVRQNMRIGGVLQDGFRQDVPDYPENAVREAVCNALMHRDYSPLARGTQVQVNMYADRLEVLSPGGLYGTVTVETLGESGVSSVRNQYLSTLLETTPYGNKGYVAENRGTGFQLIKAELAAAGMASPIVLDGISLFSLAFVRKEKRQEPSKLHVGNEAAIIDFLEENGEAGSAELAAILDVPRNTIIYRLNKLLKEGLIEATQPKRSPHQTYRLKR